jgi:hypothetical protein
MSGINRIISGELAQSKTEGKEFFKELGNKLFPEAILTCNEECGENGKDNEKKASSNCSRTQTFTECSH